MSSNHQPASIQVAKNLPYKTFPSISNSDLQRANVDGSGHNYWVDQKAGFTTQDQTDLIQFLLSLDDDPEVLPAQKISK